MSVQASVTLTGLSASQLATVSTILALTEGAVCVSTHVVPQQEEQPQNPTDNAEGADSDAAAANPVKTVKTVEDGETMFSLIETADAVAPSDAEVAKVNAVVELLSDWKYKTRSKETLLDAAELDSLEELVDLLEKHGHKVLITNRAGRTYVGLKDRGQPQPKPAEPTEPAKVEAAAVKEHYVFKKGDKVRVVRSVPSYSGGWQNIWAFDMYRYVNDGKVYTVCRTSPSGVRFVETERYGWSPESLELVVEDEASRASDEPTFEAPAPVVQQAVEAPAPAPVVQQAAAVTGDQEKVARLHELLKSENYTWRTLDTLASKVGTTTDEVIRLLEFGTFPVRVAFQNRRIDGKRIVALSSRV